MNIYPPGFSFIKADCTGNKTMLACRKVGAPVLTALAWADRDFVFGVTDDEPNCKDACSGKVVQVLLTCEYLFLAYKPRSIAAGYG